MSTEILGYGLLPPEVRGRLRLELARNGASVVETPEDVVAVEGLVVLATKPEFFAFNDTQESPFPPTLVGRCWDTPHSAWGNYMEHKDESPEFLDSRYRNLVRTAGSIASFDRLFYNHGHINVRILDVALNDGMTDRIYRLGDKSHKFLRSFADWRLSQALETTPIEIQA